ncbi:DivIVA domain-containing protein [Mycobacterium sp. 1423905.2]|uniref:DivIVA domain-containing protein n=1 Tax=Mycobacterium sp. 1423905.2 TaxID=1856859 RepID=UPI0009F686D2|nr:DivIVA domain-containing protein [Mycobacterium sp. 1423905.2]
MNHGAAEKPVGSTRLTAEQVHNVAFSDPPRGTPGYSADEVDAFLDRVEAALKDPSRHSLTSAQIRHLAFSKPPFGMRGYNAAEVDAFVRSVEQHLTGASTRESEQQAPAPSPQPDEECPPPESARIRPNLFLFWTPRWHDWRSQGGDADSSGGSGSDILDLVIDFVAPVVLDILWNRFLWVIWASVAWLLEATVAVVLSPLALLTSLLGIRRHRLVSPSNDRDAQWVWDQGSWYAMRRAHAEVQAAAQRP